VNALRETPGGYFVHESSYVDEGAEIGRETRIWHFCHVNGGAVIGERCSLGQNVVVMPGTRLGNNVKVQNNVSIYEGVECEDDVFLGPSMVFTNVMNPRSHVSRKHEYRRTLACRGCTIGANATILCGITLGEYSFVGAGAVVTRDVPPFALVVGSPARVVGWVCKCGARLDLSAQISGTATVRCAQCSDGYRASSSGVSSVETRAEISPR
jgi:UDP-2-acetamido-3-amino-2,3-dideoxy-glucuronate N-acetyltransferase